MLKGVGHDVVGPHRVAIINRHVLTMNRPDRISTEHRALERMRRYADWSMPFDNIPRKFRLERERQYESL